MVFTGGSRGEACPPPPPSIPRSGCGTGFPLQYMIMTSLSLWLIWPDFCFFVFFFQGCQEAHDPFEKDYPPWTAYRSEDYGYTRMTIFNETHLFMDQVSVDKVCKLDIKPLFLVACEKTFCYALVACTRKRKWEGQAPFLCLLRTGPGLCILSRFTSVASRNGEVVIHTFLTL